MHSISIADSKARDAKVRVNERIRAREIRVIDDEGNQLGIMTPAAAIAIAVERGLDLVEVSPTTVPPVCRILDYGKYLYQQKRKMHDARKRQTRIHVKEVKFRPKTEEHDYQFKRKHIERFLADGDKVKATIMFRGREMAHPEFGRRILDRIREELAESAIVEAEPRIEGRFMSMMLGAKKK